MVRAMVEGVIEELLAQRREEAAREMLQRLDALPHARRNARALLTVLADYGQAYGMVNEAACQPLVYTGGWHAV